MQVKEIMSHPVAVCRVDDKVSEAAKLMWEGDCGVVPVVDDRGRAIAMLTDRDVCMAAYTQGKSLSDIPVHTAMSRGLYACRPDDSLSEVEALMREHQIRRLPVLNEEGQPVGILSLNDLSRMAMKQHPDAHGLLDGLSPTSVAQTWAAICAHRADLVKPRLA